MTANASRLGTQEALFGFPRHLETTGFRGRTVCKITGVTYRQLDYWTRSGLISASVNPAQGHGSTRLYSFRDLLEVKIIIKLLDVGLGLQKVRTAMFQLGVLGIDELSSATLFCDGASVYYCYSPEEITDLLAGGQGVFGIAVPGLVNQVSATLHNLPVEKRENQPYTHVA